MQHAKPNAVEPLAREGQRRTSRKQLKRMLEGDDPNDDLRMRLELFIEQPADHGRLLSLIAGLVDLELKARLREVLPPA